MFHFLDTFPGVSMAPDGYVIQSGSQYIADRHGSLWTSNPGRAEIFGDVKDAERIAATWERGGHSACIRGVQIERRQHEQD